ncbi:MAG: hypothetical protein VW836_00475, partial [Alphaproteobacteria bacterium]
LEPYYCQKGNLLLIDIGILLAGIKGMRRKNSTSGIPPATDITAGGPIPTGADRLCIFSPDKAAPDMLKQPLNTLL